VEVKARDRELEGNKYSYACGSGVGDIRWKDEEELPAEVSMKTGNSQDPAQRTGVRKGRKLLPNMDQGYATRRKIN